MFHMYQIDIKSTHTIWSRFTLTNLLKLSSFLRIYIRIDRVKNQIMTNDYLYEILNVASRMEQTIRDK